MDQFVVTAENIPDISVVQNAFSAITHLNYFLLFAPYHGNDGLHAAYVFQGWRCGNVRTNTVECSVSLLVYCLMVQVRNWSLCTEKNKNPNLGLGAFELCTVHHLHQSSVFTHCFNTIIYSLQWNEMKNMYLWILHAL